MVRADDTTPWDLLHDGRLVAIDGGRLSIEVPHLGATFVVRLHGLDRVAWVPYSDRWDEDEITDPEAILAAEPSIVDAEWRQRERTMIVWGSLGRLRLSYVALEIEGTTLDELRAQVQAYWQRWREYWQPSDVHPLVHTAVRGEWTPALQQQLLEAWRRDRTSDLSETIAIMTEAQRDDLSATLARLAAQADASWDLLLHDPRPYAEREAENATWWDRLREGLAALAPLEPDPRIGGAIEVMLRGPSNDWFRADQVAHVIGRPDKIDDRPSFADHALALLDVHGDAGSVARLRERARRLLIEADCNTAEMSERLTTLAQQLASRWPHDRKLPDALARALRVKGQG